jgi:hypothetical protein
MDTYLAPEPPASDEAVDPYGPDSGLGALAAFCEKSGLPLPPLPEAFIPLLEQIDEAVFTSRNDLATLTDLDSLIAEVAAGEAVPFVALSHEGIGTNSWYLRYCVSLPAASLFAAVPFGGLYMDPESDRAVIGAMFEAAATLIERALAYQGAQRFVVEYRGLGRGRWCKVGDAWQDDENALATVANQLAALARRKVARAR